MASPSGDIELPAFSVSVNGAALPGAVLAQVLGVSVDEEAGLPSMFTLELPGGERNDAPANIDGDLFAVGGAVEVKLGQPDALDTLFSGEITGLEPSFLSNTRPVLVVRGYDRRHRLHRRRATRTFLQQKDSDIAATIVQEVGLTPQVTDSQVVHDYLLQANQTDMEFLQERARRIAYEMVVDGQTLFFRPVQNAESDVLTLTPADDLREFYPRLSTMDQPTTVEVRAWSPKDKTAFVSDAQAGDEVSTMSGQQTGAALAGGAFGAGPAPITSIPVFSQAEGDQIARAAFNRAILGLISGEGVCRGRTDLRAGKVIKIDKVGQRFSGRYYVHSVSHRYTPSSPYQTRFIVRRNAS